MTRRTGPPCPTCGKPTSIGSAGTHPCTRCRVAEAPSPGKGQVRPCESCGAEYRATYGAQRTCGRICGATIQARNKAASERPKSSNVNWRQCVKCAAWYTARGGKRCGCLAHTPGGGVRSLACKDCATPFEYLIVSNYPARCVDCREVERRRRARDERKKRKAKLKGATLEPVNVQKIYERDRWKCGLCGRKVDKRLQYPHPKSASLDHVLPLSCGGAHSPANVQLAHLDCNHAKSNGGSQQLALVG